MAMSLEYEDREVSERAVREAAMVGGGRGGLVVLKAFHD